MPTYHVSSHICHCDVDDGAVILNIKTEQYIGLDSVARRVLHLASQGLDSRHELELLNSGRDSSFKESLETLLAAGILTESCASSALPRAHQPQTVVSLSLAETRMKERPRVRWKERAAFAAACATAAYQLRRLSFEQMLQSVDRRMLRAASSCVEIDTDQLRRLIDVFRWLRVWAYTATDECLFDSLVLVDFLHRLDVTATLTLGVQSKPFGAHAWVQRNAVVLNDTIEKVKRYTPILALQPAGI